MTSQNGSDLTTLVNVGRSVAGHFERIGITRIAQLVNQDPVELYERMSAAFGERLDPCLLDTVMSAVDQADGRPARPWWSYTPLRKQLQAQRNEQSREVNGAGVNAGFAAHQDVTCGRGSYPAGPQA